MRAVMIGVLLGLSAVTQASSAATFKQKFQFYVNGDFAVGAHVVITTPTSVCDGYTVIHGDVTCAFARGTTSVHIVAASADGLYTLEEDQAVPVSTGSGGLHLALTN
jgi:hypothetical protein